MRAAGFLGAAAAFPVSPGAAEELVRSWLSILVVRLLDSFPFPFLL